MVIAGQLIKCNIHFRSGQPPRYSSAQGNLRDLRPQIEESIIVEAALATPSKGPRTTRLQYLWQVFQLQEEGDSAPEVGARRTPI